jgi:hypothetical protein
LEREFEELPHWHRASGMVREACRVPTEMAFLSTLLTVLALILALLMHLEVPEAVIEAFRQMLADLPLDADGNPNAIPNPTEPPRAADRGAAVVVRRAPPPRAAGTPARAVGVRQTCAHRANRNAPDGPPHPLRCRSSKSMGAASPHSRAYFVTMS